MNDVLLIVSPVFGIVGLGYFAVRSGLFDEAAERGLGGFVFNFAIPCLLFRTMVATEWPEASTLGLLIAYYGPSLFIMALSMVVAYAAFGRREKALGVIAMGGSFGNTVLLGLPLVLTAYGDAGATPLFLLIATHAVILLSVATVILEILSGSQAGLRALPQKVARGLVTNPIVMTLLAGIAYGATDWPIPGPIDAVMEKMGMAATPCALFAMGASLARFGVVGRHLESTWMSFVKLVLHPLLVWLAAVYVFDLDRVWAEVATIIAACPTGVNVYLFAQRYDAAIRLATTHVFVSSVASVVTLSVLLTIFRLT